MPEQSNDYRVVVFGAGGVGKSSLVLRFVKGQFHEYQESTIGAESVRGHCLRAAPVPGVWNAHTDTRPSLFLAPV